MRKADWSGWHERAIAHLGPDERPSRLGPRSRPLLRPDKLIAALAARKVEWVLAGSAVFALYGADIAPNDLDVVPATDPSNLHRVAEVLTDLDAIPSHQPGWRWSLTVGQCRRWRPWPAVESNLDHQFITTYGILDVVPRTAGTFAELSADSSQVQIASHGIWIANPVRVAARLGERRKDRDRGTEIERALGSFESGSRPASPW